jgi:LmbE family N-acetylglucosaminyl deacetylase
MSDSEERQKTDEDKAKDKVLLIAAHPDDPEFGCAGTMTKWASQGKTVTYLLLTSGDKGSHDPSVAPGQIAHEREKEQIAAARESGIAEVEFLRHPDGLLENNMTLRRQLSAIIRERQPDVLVTIDPWRRYQLHPDHRAAGQAALDAVYAAREWFIFPEQLVGDRKPWRVREIYLFWTDAPDYWEDITSHMEARLTALWNHESQVKQRNDDIAKRIRDTAEAAGKQCGYQYAEAFKRFELR